ncbi:hypothetical protein M413DRAFT_444900, partial [Hebeloma cylindrosporum]
TDDSLPPPEELFSRIIKTHDVFEENDVVSLKPKAVPSLEQPQQIIVPVNASVVSLISRNPALEASASVLASTHGSIENVKIYKKQLQGVLERCMQVLVFVTDSLNHLESWDLSTVDEIENVFLRFDRKVKEWASFNKLRTFLYRSEIRNGIEKVQRDIDVVMMKLSIQVNMDITNQHTEAKASQERDTHEMRDLLLSILANLDIDNLDSGDSHPVDEIMGSIQTELLDPIMQPGEKTAFKEGLWSLYQETARLPPMIDLSGQITIASPDSVAVGAYDDTFVGHWLDKEKVSLSLPRALPQDSKTRELIEHEALVWRGLNHPNIVPVYGVTYLEEDLYLVSPWMDNGTSDTFITRRPDLDRLKILIEVASGLEYLHSKNLVHGDIRAANILISANGVAHLTNYGMSKIRQEHGQDISTPLDNIRWCAPELVRESSSSTQSDVWSYGMTCLQLLSGKVPYSEISQDIRVIRALDKGELPNRPRTDATVGGLSESVWLLLRRCWRIDPRSRPTISVVKAALQRIREELNVPKFPERIFRIRDIDRSIRSMSSGSLSAVSSALGFKPNDSSSIWTSVHGSSSLISFEAAGISPSASGEPQGDIRRNLNDDSNQGKFQSKREDGTGFPGTPSLKTTARSKDEAPENPVKEATTNLRAIIKLTKSGAVSAGTLEGLVERLTTSFNLPQDIEFGDTLLTTCIDFTTPEDFFGVLSRRFYESEWPDIRPETRVRMQFNILSVINQWVVHPYCQLDDQVLWQMRNFCESAMQLNELPTGTQLLASAPLGSDFPAHKPRLRAAQIKPYDLSIALALMEGDTYRLLRPPNYLAFLRKHPGHNPIEDVYNINNKIVLWVKRSILHYEETEKRAEVLKFFINAALECRDLRNFSSASAIFTALHSLEISRLQLTLSALPRVTREKLASLDITFDPSSSHRAYQLAIREGSSPQGQAPAIPWLAVHLKELQLVLQNNPITVEVDQEHLINFQRYVKFMDSAKELFLYQPPELELYRDDGRLEYLERQLRSLDALKNIDDELAARSLFLERRENVDQRARGAMLRALGFNTRPHNSMRSEESGGGAPSDYDYLNS